MHLRDLSLRTKLLATNALMIIIPICVLIAIGTVLLGGLRHMGTLQQQALTLLWPEKGNALSVQFALSSLRVESEKKKFKLHNVESDIRLLEKAGIHLIVVQKKPIYLTEETDAETVRRMVLHKCGTAGAVLTWDMEGLFFRYESVRSGTVIMGAGVVPLMGGGEEPLFSRERREFILNTALVLLILITSAGILVLGRYLARLLSAQILAPLEEMRIAAAAIQRGNFDHALPLMGNDEVGTTCRAFDAMRCKLKRARLREQQEEQRRRELFIGVLHDIATPLTAIKGYASGLLDGIARTPEKQLSYAERIRQSAATMERLTMRLREFLRFETGQLPLKWETVCARDFLMAAIYEQTLIFSEQGLYLSMEETNIEAHIRIDCGEFARVLKNLWENSSKYRRGDTAEVRMSLAEKGAFLAICCDDNGVGVAQEDLPKLFDSFYRTDAARTNVAAGSGLGLAIVRQIVTVLGGSVYAEASPLGGLRIVLLLPTLKQEGMR